MESGLSVRFGSMKRSIQSIRWDHPNMRGWVLFVLICILSSVSAEQGGINQQTDFSGTSILALDYPNEVNVTKIDGGEMEIQVQIDPAKNISNVSWVTQICINSGVCYPPVYNLLMEYNESWGGSIEVQNQASYVNWRFDLTHENDTQVVRIPEMGFGWKVWSTCWFDGENWGGDDFKAMGDGCLSPNQDNSSTDVSSSNSALSFPSPVLVLVALSVAALSYRRN